MAAIKLRRKHGQHKQRKRLRRSGENSGGDRVPLARWNKILPLTPPPCSAYTHNMPEDLDFSARRNCVCFNLRRVTRVVTQFFDAELRRHGIRSTQGSMLAALHATGPSNMAELSEILGMERTTLLRNLRPLQRDGLVTVEGGAHRGRVELSLSVKGRKQIEKLAPACESAQRTAVQVLGEKRWSALLADLQKVASALKN